MKDIGILIVEDESIVAMELQNYIEKLDYTVVDICSSGNNALEVIAKQKIDIVLMDICIKGDMDGIETAMQIKQGHPHIEVIFLTAHLDDYNVDRAVEVDPTAYLSKPFNREELRVSLKIAMHKIDKESQIDQSLTHHIKLDDEFSYDPSTITLYYCSEMIHLTKKESDLLEIFIKNKNHIVDAYTIENAIWPDRETSSNTLRTLIKRLRQKLKHKFIETVPLRGYRFVM